MIRWQPGYVYPPVFEPPHHPLQPLDAVFFALVAIAVGVLTYRRPALGVGALIVAAPFAYARYVGHGATSITIPKAALVGLVVALAAHRPSAAPLADRRVRLILWSFVAMLAAIAISGIGALYPDAVAREFGKWLQYAITFVAATIAFAADPDDRPIWRALIVLAYVQGALCVLQLLTGAPAGVFVHGHPVPRVAGSLEGPNQFSGWLGLLIPALFARALLHRDGWLVGALVVAAACDAASLSRSGIVAALASVAVVLLVTRPPRRVRLQYAAGGFTLVALLVAVGIGLGLEARFFTLAEVPQPDRLGTRAVLWSSAVALWERRPLTGVGAGNYERELALVGHPDVHTHANSLYLQALAETGVIGLAAVLLLLAATIGPFVRTFSRRPLVTGVLAGNAGLALHQVFDYLWFFPKVGSFWALLLGIGIVEVLAAREDIDVLPDAA